MTPAVKNIMTAMTKAMINRPPVGGFPHLAETYRRAGIDRSIWFLPSFQCLYFTKLGQVAMQGTPLITGASDVATFNREALMRALRMDQAGESTFDEFMISSWKAGVVRFEVDYNQRKVTYSGALGEEYVEDYPAVDLNWV